MEYKKMGFSTKDIISSLPDALICHILSFLSTKDVALTSILSKRWKNLLAFVPNLDLDNTIYDYPKMGRRKKRQMRQSFKLFVDRVLALQGNAPLNKFSLKCKIGSDPSRVNGWILKALERGLVHLDLHISSGSTYPLPPKVLMCETLVTLKLEGTMEFLVGVEQVCLTKLKTLYLHCVAFEETGVAFAKLISSCPVLEELVMVKVMWDYWDSCSVSNPALERVKIYCENIDENPKSVSFDTPNIVYLEFADTIAAKYPKAKFDSLVEASVGLRMTPNQVFRGRDLVNRHYGYRQCKVGNAVDFLMGISNVKILYLSSEALEVLTFCCKAIPFFEKLVHLTIETNQEVDWESMPNLLKNCPNLETLVFEGLHYGDTNQCFDEGYRFKDTNECFCTRTDKCLCKPWDGTPAWLSSSPVKIIKVLMFGEIFGRIDESEKQSDLIKYFVETMPNLEQAVLYYDTPFDSDPSIMSSEFQMLDKVASAKCEIQVISDNITFSTTVYSASSAKTGLAFFKDTFPV